jgi:hypothetical protein
LKKKPTRERKTSDVKQTRVGEEAQAERVSSIPFGWDVFREFYPQHVIGAAERLFDDNALNIQTVMMVQAADALRVRSVLVGMDTDDPKYLQLERLAASQLRHLRLMAERFGANASADSQLVQVPLNLELDFGDPRIFGDDDIVH